KTGACIIDSSSRNLLERHRAPPFENRQGGVNCSRNDCRIETFAIQRFPARRVPLDRRASRSPTLPDNGRDLSFFTRINKDESLTTEAVKILLDDPSSEKRRNSSIKCIAASRQDFECGGRRQRVSSRNGAVASHDRRTFSCASYADNDQSDKQDDSQGFANSHFSHNSGTV